MNYKNLIIFKKYKKIKKNALITNVMESGF